MGTDGNGSSAPKKFQHGTLAPWPGVQFSRLWQTEEGRIFISECLDRHQTGDWGDVTPSFWLISHRSASDDAIHEGGVVVGMYPIPKALQPAPFIDRLIVVTTTLPNGHPREREVTTLLLLVTDLLS